MATGTAEKTNQATDSKDDTKAASVAGAGPDGAKGGATPEKTYRQAEVDALLGKAGQRIQAKLDAITTERDTLKSQVDPLTAEITEAKEAIATLTRDIEAMSDGDPDKQAVLKLRKEKEGELKAAKAERAAIAEGQKEVAQWKRDQLVYSVADEYVKADGTAVDMDSFKTAADKFKLSDQEGLVNLAETMGLKPKAEIPEETKTAPVKPYSGKSDGGGDNIGGMSPRDRIREADRRLRAK